MKEGQDSYRKNIQLVTLFLSLIGVSLLFGLVLIYNLTAKYIENEFASKKINVMEETLRPYNNFFRKTVPEISYYQGYLDSGSISKYAGQVLSRYKFVTNIVFYDIEISNHTITNGFRVNNFSMEPRAVYQFGDDVTVNEKVVYKKNRGSNLSLKTTTEFSKIAIKFTGFIASLDTNRVLNSNDILNVFYSITPNRITYMNIPRREEMRTFKDIMLEDLPASQIFQQDVVSFFLTPSGLRIRNANPELYQNVSFKPLMYENLETDPDMLTTDIALPGAFGDYKLYFISSKSFLRKEVFGRFFPIALSLILVYGLLGFIAFLIYGNLNINRKMFKLQYDFINNFTHEFKTPVAVIKIAGNNIRGAKELSDTELKRYGKILDEEADKLNDLMNKLLSFTQIENRSIQIKKELINLEVFVQNIIDEYEIKYPDHAIQCDISRSIDYFKSDPVLLSSLFHNLIDNAYKYSPQSRKVLKIEIKKYRKNIVFRFRDKGIGIRQEELKNIFKKFYRIQNEFNQQGSVGLGLAFCKELINFMSGTIAVKSKVGAGSEFVITLPYEV